MEFLLSAVWKEENSATPVLTAHSMLDRLRDGTLVRVNPELVSPSSAKRRKRRRGDCGFSEAGERRQSWWSESSKQLGVAQSAEIKAKLHKPKTLGVTKQEHLAHATIHDVYALS